MKTLFFCVLFVSNVILGAASDKSMPGELPAESAWGRSESGIWFGDYNTWYKIDKSSIEAKLSNSIKISYNKKKWQSSNVVAWQDKQGRWYYINNNRLLYTNDNKHWEEVPNRSWLGMDDVWYRLDSNWDLWEVREALN